MDVLQDVLFVGRTPSDLQEDKQIASAVNEVYDVDNAQAFLDYVNALPPKQPPIPHVWERQRINTLAAGASTTFVFDFDVRYFHIELESGTTPLAVSFALGAHVDDGNRIALITAQNMRRLTVPARGFRMITFLNSGANSAGILVIGYSDENMIVATG